MEIFDSTWFTMPNGTAIGIVLGEDKLTHRKKAYMGLGRGQSQEDDEKWILEHGYPVMKGVLLEIANKID